MTLIRRGWGISPLATVFLVIRVCVCIAMCLIPVLRISDQWANYYSRYTVTSAVVKATFMSAGSGNSERALCGLNMDRDTTLHAAASLDGTVEHNRGRYTRALLPNSREKATVKGRYVARRFWKEDLMKEDEHVTAFGSDPSKVAYCHLWAGCENALTNSIRVDYQIWYRVKLTRPLGVASS